MALRLSNCDYDRCTLESVDSHGFVGRVSDVNLNRLAFRHEFKMMIAGIDNRSAILPLCFMAWADSAISDAVKIKAIVFMDDLPFFKSKRFRLDWL